jgi:hypothetical protein
MIEGLGSRFLREGAMPPKSREFHQIEREVLAPMLAEMGFSRPRGVGLGGWVRKEGSNWLVVWTQLGKWNSGDGPEGNTFTVEFQLDNEPRAGLGGRRARLYELLTDSERAEYLAIHNDVVAKAKPDPDMLAIFKTGDREWYLSTFKPRSTPFGPNEDPWFRYTDSGDARRWLVFVGAVLSGASDRFLATAT